MKLAYHLSIAALLFGSISCSDFLDRSPYNSISSSDFYQTEEDFQQAINAAYAPLTVLYKESQWMFGEMRSDNTTYIYHISIKSGLEREDIEQLTETSTNTHVSTKYSNFYVLIGRVNQILASIDNVTEISTEEKNRIKGEALFLRAFSYFDLVQYFGGVPLHTEPSTYYEESFKPRASVEEVYAQIEKDALEAISLLPTRSNQELGRATKGSAQTLLGNVYMVLKRWADAEKVLKEVVNSGEYELQANYASLFETTNKNNKESIFEIQYMQDATKGQENRFAYNFLPFMVNPSAATGASPNPCTSNTNEGGYNTPSPDLIAAYEEGDKRRDASIGIIEGTLNANYALEFEGLKSIEGYQKPDGITAYPYIKKFVTPHTNAYYGDDNWPVYRYAEVLLFLAEAVNEQNRPDEAIKYLNNVYGQASIRGRAGLAPIASQSVDALRKVIAHERQIELAFESKRWLDLVRTGKVEEVLNEQFKNIRNNPKTYYWEGNTSPLDSYYNFNKDKILLPIPMRELDLNNTLVQNPGY